MSNGLDYRRELHGPFPKLQASRQEAGHCRSQPPPQRHPPPGSVDLLSRPPHQDSRRAGQLLAGLPASGGLDEDLLPHGGRRGQCVRRDPVHHPLPSGLDPRSGRQGEI